MKKRKILMAVLALVLLLSTVMLLRSAADYKKGEEIYAEAQQLVELPELPAFQPAPAVPQPAEPAPPAASAPEEPEPVYIDPYADALRAMDFTALREVNPEVLGWILIPDTVVSYPLLQHADNDYYLKRTWKTWRSAVGSIFLECRSSADLSDFHTVIYGHNMNNGSMFGSLKKYKALDYWAKHPKVYLTTDGGSFAYEIFAAYEVSTEGLTYRIGFGDDSEKQAFLDFCMAQSVIDTGVVPTTADRIVTLSTCTGRGHSTRWVVQAVLKAAVPAEEPVQEQLPKEEAALPEEAPVAEPISGEVPEGEVPEIPAEETAGESGEEQTAEQEETTPEEASDEAVSTPEEAAPETDTPEDESAESGEEG